MIITREWAMPNSETFSIKPIKALIEKYIKDKAVIIDPFANKSKYGTITNDLNPNTGAMFHIYALEFLKMQQDGSADMILYDPPYSMRQASECYKSFGKEKLSGTVTNMRYWSSCKKECARILKAGGVCVSCGWNSMGLGKNRGFTIAEVLLVPHGGNRNDTIVVVEVKEIKKEVKS